MNDDSGDEAVTAIASPVADRTPALERCDSNVDNLVLIQALPEHLKAGRTIYVRGKRACITEMDYPNIFWCLDGTEVIKHRNYEIDREMFQVVQGTEGIRDIGVANRSHASSRPPLFSMASNDEAETAAGDSAENSEDQTSVVDSLIGQLSFRPLSVFSEEHGAEISCFDTNTRIHLLHCSSSSFRFSNKLSAMFIQGCSECQIQYNSVIAIVELLKCFSTEIRCTNECGTITIESCADIVVTFPTTSSSVLIVCTNSRNVVLRADQDGNIVKETVITIEDQQTEGEGEGEESVQNSNSTPLVHHQIRTLWDGASFDSRSIERDSSHISGHIRNLNG